MNEHAIGFVTGLVLAILVVGMVKRILYKSLFIGQGKT